MDPDQTAPTGAVWSGSTLFIYEDSRVNKCEFSVYAVTIIMKCTHVCAAQKAY